MFLRPPEGNPGGVAFGVQRSRRTEKAGVVSDQNPKNLENKPNNDECRFGREPALVRKLLGRQSFRRIKKLPRQGSNLGHAD